MDTAAGHGLGSIEHVVVLMLENRSFDHMLGYLYRDAGNVSPAGQPFDGLTGRESNPDSSGAILKTVEQRWGLPALTARGAAAPAFGDVLTLTAARTDDVLAGVTVPVSGGTSPAAGQLSHLEAIRAELLSRRLPAGAHPIPPGNAVIEP